MCEKDAKFGFDQTKDLRRLSDEFRHAMLYFQTRINLTKCVLFVLYSGEDEPFETNDSYLLSF